MEPMNKPETITFRKGWIAPLWRRLLAWLIDFLFISAALGLAFAWDAEKVSEWEPVLPSLVWFGYYALLESSRLRGTLGKFVCRIEVVSVRGKRLSMAIAINRCIIRGVYYFAFGLVVKIGLYKIPVFDHLAKVSAGLGIETWLDEAAEANPILPAIIGAVLGVMVFRVLPSSLAILSSLRQAPYDLWAGTVVVQKGSLDEE